MDSEEKSFAYSLSLKFLGKQFLMMPEFSV